VVSEFLDAAVRIGERLCAEALHDGNRCTWFGGSMEPVGGEWIGTRRTFGGDIYAGTAGAALFLAQLHRFAPSEKVRATALAALEQALDRAERDASLSPGALYTGAFGIGFAAAEGGATLDAETMAQRGVALAHRHAEAVDPQMFDVVGGTAGRIGALIRLHERFGESWMLDAAVAAGRHLVATADRSVYGWSWGYGTSKFLLRNLTGYSHGAAGVALALLELYRITSEEEFRTAAAEAFRYERSCYSPQQRNWPDFRRTPEQTMNDPLSYGYAWCHGAPGIGMSRLQAFRITRKEDVRQEAILAMESTRAAIEPSAFAGAFGLCHGTAGNGELFLQAFEILNDEKALAFAESLARGGIERFSDGPWPCGLFEAAGEAPGLMVGIAGVGYFFLRLHGRQRVPSMLTVGSSENP
jgi:lantibiotic modifying enzyme